MTEKELEKLNATTWEELNPDWIEEGELTDYFAPSQFERCPGCGESIGNIRVYVATEDLDVAVTCRNDGWHIYGSCPSEAIDKWNRRVEA